MKFIPIMEISSQIMTLIEEAEKEIIIVSPYVDIRNWDKLKRCLNNAIERKVAITFYVREHAKQDLSYLRQLNVKLVLIKDLHAKIYLNDTYGIVSSQNLYLYSDINSIDFAYSTETDEERFQLVKLINKYLSKTKTKVKNVPVKISVTAKVEEVLVADTKLKSDYNMFLSEKHLAKIHRIFEDEFPEIKINSTATYVYCNRLLPFGDVMFREGFEIRFKHNIKDYSEIINIIESLKFRTNHYKYKKILKMDKGQPSSMLFIPQEFDNIYNLIDDYIFMTNKIIAKTEKAVDKYII